MEGNDFNWIPKRQEEGWMLSTLTAEKKKKISRSVSMPIQLCEERRGNITKSNTYTIQ